MNSLDAMCSVERLTETKFTFQKKKKRKKNVGNIQIYKCFIFIFSFRLSVYTLSVFWNYFNDRFNAEFVNDFVSIDIARNHNDTGKVFLQPNEKLLIFTFFIIQQQKMFTWFTASG